jgi:hypothetical protein
VTLLAAISLVNCGAANALAIGIADPKVDAETPTSAAMKSVPAVVFSPTRYLSGAALCPRQRQRADTANR